MITRRTLFGMLAAPAVIRVADLMPIRTVIWTPPPAPGFMSVHEINAIVKALKAVGRATVNYRDEMVDLQYVPHRTLPDDPLSQKAWISWKGYMPNRREYGSYWLMPPVHAATDKELRDFVVTMTRDIDRLRREIVVHEPLGLIS